ncbi:hypothetical protein HPP92_003763 [Vanilla planifolia]|uniref:Uncharacterized protein n=1 Tax=Vanilla planifolia TaxID=51239 RepID=A0A835VHI5_VANPL|nr:hypothetical protein HPP92_003763 [Vanilla planifolia]
MVSADDPCDSSYASDQPAAACPPPLEEGAAIAAPPVTGGTPKDVDSICSRGLHFEAGRPLEGTCIQNEVANVEVSLLGQNDGDCDDHVRIDAEAGYPNLSERQKKLFELRLKMNEARKANQMAMVAEKKKLDCEPESRGMSKEKWLEDRKKKIGKLLDSNGLDLKKAYMLDTQESAEAKYKKWEKDPAPSGWDVFNQKSFTMLTRSVQRK